MKILAPAALILIGCASNNNSETTTTDSASQANTVSMIGNEANFVGPEFEQDSVIASIYADEEPDSVLEFSYEANSYFDTKAKCVNGTLITIYLTTLNQEQKFDLVWASSESNNIVFSPTLRFDVTPYQGEASAELNNEYALSDNCSTLAVKEDYEGGDIDLTRTSKITFYAIEKGVISEILAVMLEDTRVSEYFVTGKENENSTSELAEIEVLDTSADGFKRVRVTSTSKVNGEETSKVEKIYRFTGSGYGLESETTL